MTGLRPHGRQVAEVDAHEAPPDRSKAQAGPAESKVDPLDHRVNGSDDGARLTSPNRRIVVLSGSDDEAPAGRADKWTQ